MPDKKKILDYTNECYNCATEALNNLIANIAPATHAKQPLGTLIEEMKQSILAMQINAKIIITKINQQ